MLERAVSIDGVTYRHHEVTEITHTSDSHTYVKVRSTAGAATVHTRHEVAYNSRLTFPKAEEAIAELEFFAEVADPYAAVVAEQSATIAQQSQLVDTIADMLTDEQAATVPNAYPEWTADGTYAQGQRVRMDGQVYRCLQAHDGQADRTPTDAHSLWASVIASDNPDEPLEWVQPESTNGYKEGATVIFEGVVYRSKIDDNVWSPADYPQGWEVVA